MGENGGEPRIGVYVCHCGTNIAGVLDVKDLVEYTSSQPNVVLAKNYVYVCSAPGQETIRKDIEENKLNRVLIAACSPRLHEGTFRKTLGKAGLNPYLLEQANIREHCSWVHSENKDKAQKKAKDLVRMGLAKARLLEPLERKAVDVKQRALVVGGGVTGMRCAIDLASRGFDVHLVERSPALGGRAALLNRVNAEKEAKEVVAELIDGVASNERITVHTLTKVKESSGFIGNFFTKLKTEPRYVLPHCTNCGRCIEVCPEETANEYDYGLSKRKAIYLPFAFAHPAMPAIDMNSCTRCGKCVGACPEGAIDLGESAQTWELDIGVIVAATGFSPYTPTEGEFGYRKSPRVVTLTELERMLAKGDGLEHLAVNGTQKNVVFIGCVGSRQKKTSENEKVNQYCSRICCSATIKNALLLKEKYPDVNSFFLFRDIRTYGRNEYLYRDALDKGVRFIHYPDDEPPQVTIDHALSVRVKDLLSKQAIAIKPDLVVLSVGMETNGDSDVLRKVLNIDQSADGFFQEAHIKMRPLESSSTGIFIAGACQAPKDIPECIASASAAAGKASILLARGVVELEPTKAMVTEFCDGCAICIEPCLGGALTLVEYQRDGETKKNVQVNEALCRGCGVCMATCPKKGIVVRHFTLDQLQAMVAAALTE